uniref:Integrase core domain containing protein n=1 Tax=Solanum tuberosum TaxID=4113 RepID=M1DG08_SOLTU
MEHRIEGMMDRKVQAVNKRLDAFELRVLERSAPATDLSALQADLAGSGLTLMPFLLHLHGTAEERPAPTHAKGKRHCSHRTEEENAHKRQRRQEKEARRDSIVDEELRQQRVRERVAGASSSVPVAESTTESAMIADVGTTEGVTTTVPAGSGKPDPPTC